MLECTSITYQARIIAIIREGFQSPFVHRQCVDLQAWEEEMVNAERVLCAKPYRKAETIPQHYSQGYLKAPTEGHSLQVGWRLV